MCHVTDVRAQLLLCWLYASLMKDQFQLFIIVCFEFYQADMNITWSF